MTNNTLLHKATPITPVDRTRNVLNEFRTYSYHFILMALNTTDYFDSANLNPKNTTGIDTSSSTFFQRPYQGTNPSLRRSVITDQIGSRIILIDTREDTDFTIQNVEWGTTFVGDANSGLSTVAFDTYLSDGKMTIVEPRGMNFLNVLAEISDVKKLNTDPAAMPFLIKVIFVGQRDDGSVETIYSVPPFGFYFTDITGSFNEIGATYNLQYVGAVNGASWEQTYDSIVDGVTFEFENKPMPDMLRSISNKINSTYMAMVHKNAHLYAAAGININDACLINWNIQLDPKSPGKILPYLNDFGGTTPPQCTEDGNHIVLYKGTKEGGVKEVIHKLLMSSPTWQTYRIKGYSQKDINKMNQTMYTHKITTEVKKTNPNTSNRLNITYTIDEYSFDAISINDSTQGQANAKPVVINPNQVYQFDYVYTGENVDVIDFDVNLTMGYALWLSLITTQALPSQEQDSTGSYAEPPMVVLRPITSGNLNPKFQWRKGTPLYPPAISIDTHTKEFQHQGTVAAADSVWRNFFNYQAVQSELTIRGNPLLIDKFVQPSRNVPDYVKINIKMPTTNEDIWEYNQQDGSQPNGYYKTIWFQGYFNIVTARNIFNEGEFTQRLNLIEIPQVSSDMTVSTVNTNTNVSSGTSGYPPSSASTGSTLDRTVTQAIHDQKQTLTPPTPLQQASAVLTIL
jgi:hypothetical protein